MSKPKSKRGAELCLTVEPDGLYVYANRPALRTLADLLGWIADSNPREHFESHVRFDLDGVGRRRRPSWVLFHRDVLRARSRPDDFELTFMAVEPRDLRKLRRHERRGLLPKMWREEPRRGQRRRGAGQRPSSR